ncbi:MAG: FG-GAP repeat domain-containing protein [Bdellovibrionales bacterium]
MRNLIILLPSVLLTISCSDKSAFEGVLGPLTPGDQSVEQESVPDTSSITDFVFQKNIPLTANYFQNMKSFDVDQDDDLDVILTETNAKKITFLENDGEGDFTVGISLPATGRVYSNIIADDINNDGHFDITVSSSVGFINIWLNDGSNEFPNRIDIPTTINGSAVQFISSGDINNDGNIDIAIANTTDSTAGSLVILMNDGTPMPSFTQTKLISGLAPYGVVIFDLNHDGFDDIAFTSRTDGLVRIYKSESGNLVFHSSLTGSIDPNDSLLTDIVSGDFNKDGSIDLAWGSECRLGKEYCHKSVYNQHIYTSFNSNSTFSTPAAHLTKAYGDVRMLDTYDMNNDGLLDLISIDDMNTNPFSANGEFASLSFLINSDSGFSGVQNKMLAPEYDPVGGITAPGSSYSNSFALGDFNNDGLTDFIADAKLNGSSLSSGVRVYFGRRL